MSDRTITPGGRVARGRLPGKWCWATVLAVGLGAFVDASDPLPVAPAPSNAPQSPMPVPGVTFPSVVAGPGLLPVVPVNPTINPMATPVAPPALAIAAPVAPFAVPAARVVPQPPPDAKQPDMGAGAGQPQPLPQPKLLPFGDDKVRLPRMGLPQNVLGATPIPTAQDLEDFRQFIDGVIDPRNTLDLIQGRARLILLKQAPTQTQLVDPAIATFNLLQPTQLTVIGRQPGTTVLNLWFDDPKNKGKEKVLSYLVRVLPDPEAKARLEAIYKELEKEINKNFPNSRIRLTLVGDKLMVSGQAHDVYDATQILRLVSANAPGGQASNAPGATPSGTPIENIRPTRITGDPTSPTATPGITDYIVGGASNVINNMRVPGEQQVMLRVVVAEVNRSAARSIGLNFTITNQQGITVFGQQLPGLGITNLPINLDNGRIPIALNALRTLNYARSLAEPNLTAINGQAASFQAGGSFPVPVVGGFGATGIGAGGLQGVQFVPFGVQVQFTPFISDRDRIRLVVNASVSTRDNTATTNIGGAAVPGLNQRTFQTTVELREGQTLAVAGLIQNNIGATADRVPFFGDLPIIGRIASIDRSSHGEQELVILVTPELVHPLEAREVPPLPGNDVYEPGDIEFYLYGRLESRRSYDYRSSVMTDIHRMLRYRRCEQIYIIGPTGHTDAPVVGK